MVESFWVKVSSLELTASNTPVLAQGDYLPECLVPACEPAYGVENEVYEVPVCSRDVIVMTQTCDLASDKAPFVAVCPIDSLTSFEEVNPGFRAKGKWEDVRRGRVEGLHLLGPTKVPGDNAKAIVVDFRQIYSLPIGYILSHAESLDGRWRLRSPFLEHFSQSFARFFMRVGLPSSIPPYK